MESLRLVALSNPCSDGGGIDPGNGSHAIPGVQDGIHAAMGAVYQMICDNLGWFLFFIFLFMAIEIGSFAYHQFQKMKKKAPDHWDVLTGGGS